MTNQEQLDVLWHGAEKWNAWRNQHENAFIDLNYAILRNAYSLSGANLGLAQLSHAHLPKAQLRHANLWGANLSNAYLNNADLSGANLDRTNLNKADLSGADLSGANLNYSNLSGADLSSANLSGADLSSANLSGADLSSSNLRGANLSSSDLIGADLSSADLSSADLSHASTNLTHFNDIDLRTIKGLEHIRHRGPSYISTSTLEQSGGEIPEIFLKGAGVGPNLIDYARSLFGMPIEYYTCFISYSSKDELFARRLHNDLQQESVRCWFAPEDMDIGDKIKHRIDESIRLYDKMLLILSEHSIASTWVAYETERALKKEPKGIPNVLYPIRVDKAILRCRKLWAKDIKESSVV